MKNILVSIILPVYKVEKYIDVCVESIVNQTYKNIEIILVDDGSPDNSGKICDEWAKKDSRIKVIHKENGGASSARKKGIEVSKGDYISFIDADDYIDKDYIKKMVEASENGKVDMVCCNFVEIGDTCFDKDNYFREDCKLESKKDFYKYFLDKYIVLYVLWGKIISRRVIDKMEFPSIRYTEDTYGQVSLFEHLNSIVGLNYDGYFYVRNDQSLSFKVENETVKRCNGLETYSLILDKTKGLDDDVFDKVVSLNIHHIFECIKSYVYYQKTNDFYKNIKPKIKKLPNKLKYVGKEYLTIKLYSIIPHLVLFIFQIKKNINKLLNK